MIVGQCLSVLTISSLVLGIRRSGRQSGTNRQEETSGNAVDCTIFTDVKVAGHESVGESVKQMCAVWRRGDFPVESASRLRLIADYVFDTEGPYREVEALAVSTYRNSSPFCWKATTTRLEHTNPRAMLAGECSMYVDEVCYAECPHGTKPIEFLGKFSPLCSTQCSETGHTYSCGLACAKGRWDCWSNILDQVFEVAKTVGDTDSFFIGTPAIVGVADRVIKLAEFFIETHWKIMNMISDEERMSSGEITVVTILMLMQAGKESVDALKPDVDIISTEWSEIVDLLSGVTDEAQSWWRVNTEFIAQTVVNYGSGNELAGLSALIKPFDYPVCAGPDSETSFVIDRADDWTLLGPWFHRGTHAGRPTYSPRASPDVIMRWHEDVSQWIIANYDAFPLYVSHLDFDDYPVHGWQNVEKPEQSLGFIPVSREAGKLNVQL